MSDNQSHNQQELSKKEKAQMAGKDIAELGAKGISRYYGGEAGGQAADALSNTKYGQKKLEKAGNKIARVPGLKGRLAKMQPMVSENKGLINNAISSSTSANNMESTNANNETQTINNNINNKEDTNNTSNDSNETNGKALLKGLKQKNPLMKFLLIGGGSSFFSLIMFIVILIVPLFILDIIDIDDLDLDFGAGSISSSTTQYTEVTSNIGYWWPVGSLDITTNNSKEFATGTPSCTYVSSKFGYRTLDGQRDYHSGMDIACSPSDKHNIIAVKDGIVEAVVNGFSDKRDKSAGYGNHIKIKHSDGTLAIYAHLYIDSIKVAVGETVTQGQVLGKMGSSGNSTGTHLHFEVRINAGAVNPANYISSSNPRPA